MEALLEKLLYGAPALTLLLAWFYWDQRQHNRYLLRAFRKRFERQLRVLEALKERLRRRG